MPPAQETAVAAATASIDDYKVVVRPRGGLSLRAVGTPTIFTPVCRPLGLIYQEALKTDRLRVNPVNNTFTISTPVDTKAQKYVDLKNLKLEDQTFEMSAYFSPPDDSVRGIICHAHSGENYTKIMDGLIPFNPILPIVDARQLRKTTSVLLTITGTKVPQSLCFRGGLYICYLFYSKVESCFNCCNAGHPTDVCRKARTNLSPMRGEAPSERRPGLHAELHHLQRLPPHGEQEMQVPLHTS
ncbi:hypothetical protein V5799_014395 [Amblyomma americanum]|uniref:Uncharacterized protein n=1 Tax=Amblyomma americanum TaxID=6943 RepID=A0AAQ4E367_AMBAM